MQHLPAAAVAHFDVPLIVQIVQCCLERAAVFGNIDGFHIFVVHAKCDGFQPVKVDSKGKVFMSLDRQEDRAAVLEKMGEQYGVSFTAAEVGKFKLANSFGVPIKKMKDFLALPSDKQDAVLPSLGIPTDSTDNQFKEWVKVAREQNRDLRIAIKADQTTPYAQIKNIMKSLQDIRENRYNLITSLKVVSEDM